MGGKLAKYKVSWHTVRIVISMWYFSFSFLIHLQQILKILFLLCQYGVWGIDKGQIFCNNFCTRLQHQMWKKWRGLNTLRSHCIQYIAVYNIYVYNTFTFTFTTRLQHVYIYVYNTFTFTFTTRLHLRLQHFYIFDSVLTWTTRLKTNGVPKFHLLPDSITIFYSATHN